MNEELKNHPQPSLSKKLGIKPGFNIKLINEPEYYFDLFTDLPPDININTDDNSRKDLIHYFTKSAEELLSNMNLLRGEIKENGIIWVSWQKQSAKTDTDLNENIIREIALKNGLVDVKVCSIDSVWSALKLVIRLKDRKSETNG